MKNFVLILICASMVVIFASCSPANNPEPIGSSSSDIGAESPMNSEMPESSELPTHTQELTTQYDYDKIVFDKYEFPDNKYTSPKSQEELQNTIERLGATSEGYIYIHLTCSDGESFLASDLLSEINYINYDMFEDSNGNDIISLLLKKTDLEIITLLKLSLDATIEKINVSRVTLIVFPTPD